MLKKRKLGSLLLAILFILQLLPGGVKPIPEDKSFAEELTPSAVPQIVNLLGSAGDCDGLAGWTASNGITSLNKSQKVFGTASINFTTTAGDGFASKDISSTLGKDEKYYLVSVYLRNNNVDNAFSLKIMDVVGSTYTTLCETPSQMLGAFRRVGVKFDADAISSSSTKRELRINVVQNSQTVSQNGLFDGIMINEITEEEYLSETAEALLVKYPYSGGTKYPTYPIELGTNTAFVIGEDGSVKAWGINTEGQLGLGNLVNQPVPVSMPVLTDVRSVASGQYHGLAILNDGTVKSWGQNDNGQLGINSTDDMTNPIDIPGLGGVKQIAAGQYHSIALMEDGTVKVWGKNNFGQLGLGDIVDRFTPVTIPGLAGVKQIAAGYNSSYAVMNDGTVKAWGYNGLGRLGLGDFEDRKTPVTIPDLLDVWYIAAGAFHVFAHTADGKIKSWGKNAFGQLGLGDNIDRNKPELVSEISGVRKIVAGVDFTAALMNNGTVKTWGYNGNGQLGLGNNKDQVYPQIVPELEGVKYINIGGAYAFAVLNDGTMKYWGKKIGDVGNVNVPTEISINGMRANSSPVMGINYPSSYTEEGVKASVLGTDGNCESTTGWAGGNATVALDTSAKLYGSNAIKGSITASGVGYIYRNVKSILDNNKCYFISAYTKSGSTNSVNLYCNFGTEKNATTNATTAYVRRGIKIKPSDMGAAAEYRVGLKLNTGTAAQYGFIDNLIIVEITQDEYDKLNETQLMTKYSYKNLLESDGDCEELGAWNAKTGTATLDTANKAVGNNGIKIVSNAGTDTGLEKYLMPLDTNKYYLLSGYGKSASGGNLEMLIGNAYGLSTGGGTTNPCTSSTFVRKGFVFKPTSSIGVLSLVAKGITGQQHTAYFDGIMLKEISQNEYTTLSVEELLQRYPYEGSKTEFEANTMMPATLKMKSGDNNVVISVSDVDNDVLTCSLYVDDESVARDTKVVSNAWQEQDVNLALGSLTDGDHLIKVEVWDGKETVQYSTNVNAYYNLKSIVGTATTGYYGLMTDGTVKKWGGTNGSLTPTVWTELSNVKQIVTDGRALFAVLNDGTVKSWGWKYLGTGVSSTDIPMEIEGLTNVREMVIYSEVRYAILNDGTVMVWGNNSDIGISNIELPIKSKHLSGVERVVSGPSYVSYTTSNGETWVYGRLSASHIYSTPARFTDCKLFTYYSAIFKINSNGDLYACGDNSYGQLGLGSTESISSFQLVKSNVKEVFSSGSSTFIILNNGEVWACGQNTNGQLGLGDKVNKNTPTKVNDYTGASKFVFDTYASFAIYQDGKVKTAGTNTYGTLGLGNNTDALTPQNISSISDVVDITANNGSVLAYLKDGSVKAWGKNEVGILGLGDTNSRNLPVEIYKGRFVPKIIYAKPGNSQVVTGEDGFITPSVNVTSRDNEKLSIMAYLDSSQIPYDSKACNSSYKAKEVIFNPIDNTNLTEGNHSIKFEVSNGISTTILTRSFIYDRLPSAGTITTTSTTNTITATGTGIDSRGLNTNPIRFCIGTADSGWIKQDNDLNVSKVIKTGVGSTKIVKVDNGYVAGINYGTKINFYKADNNVKSWSNIGFVSCVDPGNDKDFAIASKGNEVYCIYNTSYYNGYYSTFDTNFIRFNSTISNQANIGLNAAKIISGDSVYNKSLSLAMDNSGVIYAAWKRSNNNALYYSKSNNGSIWESSLSLYGYSDSSDVSIFKKITGNAEILFARYSNSSSALRLKNDFGDVYIAGSNGFDIISPVGCQDNDGIYHVAWLAKDATDNTAYNVFYSKSETGNWNTWSTPIKLTTGNIYNCSNLSICTDSQNRVHLAWARNNEIQKKTFDGIWGDIETVAANGENPSFCSNNPKQTQPVLIYRDKTANEVRLISFKPKSASYTATGLLPGKKYTVKFETKDMSGNIAISTKEAFTKAAVPSATIGTKTATTANITITDSNGADTKYKVKVGDKYLLADGTLSTKADLISTKSIKIKGLKANTTYQVFFKAVNGENIETKYSPAVSLLTANTVPGVPANVKTASYGTNVKVSWDELDGAQSYDVEIDSVVYTNATTSTSYVKAGLAAGVSHNVRVRAANTAGTGAWSSIYTTTVAASKTNQIPVNYSVGKIFNIVLSAGNLKDVDICTFKLIYDPAKLEVLDLCADTLDKELATGDIADTGVKVVEFNPNTGVVRYTVTKSANDGAAWTGALNSVKFRSKSATPSTITYILE
ncbi:MAG TPA: hypothetical protein VIO64_06155 [Pseudobacteroides sp.]|uniref:RCC1 domain-containing protein n=1 Tax=Pseudobacteroides sp. TaxID=1968840 RepID=UPI002F9400C3